MTKTFENNFNSHWYNIEITKVLVSKPSKSFSFSHTYQHKHTSVLNNIEGKNLSRTFYDLIHHLFAIYHKSSCGLSDEANSRLRKKNIATYIW